MKDLDSKNTYLYSQEDVQQILQLAIARQADDNEKEFSYQQLVEIASELDICPESLQIAQKEWVFHQGEIQQRQAFDNYRISRFKKRLSKFAVINVMFLLVNILSVGTLSWSLYILLFWGTGMSLDTWNTFKTKAEDYEAAFQKWYRKHQIKSSFNNLVNKFLKATSV